MSDGPARFQSDSLKIHQEGPRLDIVLNRPDQRNAINREMAQTFSELVNWLPGQEDIRVVVLRGAGGHFCAGGDIKERLAQSQLSADEAKQVLFDDNHQAGLGFTAFENLPQVTIAAVEGSAFGGGLGYACLADITIASKSARFGMPETTLGVAPAQIAQFVVKRLGLSKARQLALTAERFDGEQAYEIGLAHYLCDHHAMDETIKTVVSKVLKGGPKANAATKAIMNRVGKISADEMSRYSAETFADLNAGAEAREGQSAFAQKRKPDWQNIDGDR